MVRKIEVKLLPHELKDEKLLRDRCSHLCKVQAKDITHIQVVKRSLDARGSTPVFRLQVEVYIKEPFVEDPSLLSALSKVSDTKTCIVVGAGPAGYFAALELIELGIKPIVLDRGKDAQSRRRDLRAIQQFGEVNPDSNYCFGEGGAGTYSDGKLYTRSHKRGSIYKALKLFVEHGADPDIMVDAHPHIGSNKLPKIVQNIRQSIEEFGGEVHFNSRVTDFIIHQKQMLGVVVNHEKQYRGDAILLATGHSARDIYYLLDKHKVKMEVKPFALGVRIEHPQPLIDKIQYNQAKRPDELPAASYRLACQVDGRGVFSFCMCPGGLIVPAATAPGEIVVNGMSMSRRDSPYANSGLVVAVEPEDLEPFKKHGLFAGLEFQKSVEQAVFKAGDGSQKAPAQRVPDFVDGKVSASSPGTSYIPGVYPAAVHEILPQAISKRLREGLKQFGKMMKGYYSNEAQVVATESRTSAPVKIPRDRETYMHEEITGLFPCGEGAGYAGGIISAAMDGQNVAKAIHKFILKA
ncbi:MAG: FAD-dependent oxidoreductase [Saprospiraceae bacterium]